MKISILFSTFLFIQLYAVAQDTYIRTKEGKRILFRKQLIDDCLRSLHKNRSDQTALSICECQTSKLDKHFSGKQYRKNTTSNGVIDISDLLNEDTLFKAEIQKCFTNSGQTTLLQAESFEDEFVADCIKILQKNTEKTLDTNRLMGFCDCQLKLVKEKKITDAEMQTLSNPNSLLFYEMMYKCGDPFAEEENLNRNWHPAIAKDVTGPSIDTIKMLSLNGMTYVKMRIGSMTQIWLFDTGASDLLINKEMEATLKNEQVIKESDYLGNVEYEMANGMIDTCRKYKIDNIKMGNYVINNVLVAVTDKGKRIIVGKTLLNKFSKWVFDNRENTLVLTK